MKYRKSVRRPAVSAASLLLLSPMLCMQAAVAASALPTSPSSASSLPPTFHHHHTGTSAQSGQPVQPRPPRNVDLSSTVKSVLAPVRTAPITVGGTSFIAAPGSQITGAERMAIFQVLRTGQQSLVIGSQGNAVGGSFNLGARMSSNLANLVIPQGVTGIRNAALGSLNITGNLVNNGTLLAVSTNPSVSSALISANNILNNGLLSSVVPNSSILGLNSAVLHLSLSLNAVQNIVNSGQIMSSGNLSLYAGNSISNVLGAAGASAPSIQSVGSMSLYAGSGTFTNAGLIRAYTGNVIFNADPTRNIVLNNTNGSIQALAGNISVRDASYAGKANLSILGGNLATQAINLNSGCGTVEVAVDQADGVLNVTAGNSAFSASTKDLVIGNINVSADPAFYNTTGDVTIAGNLVFSGSDLAIVASGDVLTAPGAGIIDTSSGLGNAGAITIVAGAAFTAAASIPPPAPGAVQPVIPDPNDANITLTITGGSATGGKIDLSTGAAITKFNSSSSAGNGGNVTLIAFSGTNPGSGTVTVPSNVTIQTGAAAGSTNGNVTVIAGDPIPFGTTDTPVKIASINTAGGATGGDISINYSQPQIGGSSGVVTIAGGTMTNLVNGYFTSFETGPSGIADTGNMNVVTPTSMTINSAAGLQVDNLTVNTGSLSLIASGTGQIQRAAGTSLTASSVSLTTSGVGAIGTSSNNILVNTPSLSVNSGGDAYVTSTGSVTINNGYASGDLNITANGSMTLPSSIGSNSGNVTLTTKDASGIGADDINITYVGSSSAIYANNAIVLNAGGTGGIFAPGNTPTPQGSPAPLVTSEIDAPSVSLTTNNGNIGTVAHQVEAGGGSLVSVNAGGSGSAVVEYDPYSGSVTLNASSAGGSFNFNNAIPYIPTSPSSLNIGSVSTQAGNILLAADSAPIHVLSGATIIANGGSLTIQNTDASNPTILIDDNVTIASVSAIPAQRQVSIMVGTGPIGNVPGAAPANATQTLSNGGTVIFNNGILVPNPPVTLIANAGTITFDVGPGGIPSQIQVGTVNGGDFIEAVSTPPPPQPIPPVPPPAPPASTSRTPLVNSSSPNLASVVNNIGGSRVPTDTTPVSWPGINPTAGAMGSPSLPGYDPQIITDNQQLAMGSTQSLNSFATDAGGSSSGGSGSAGGGGSGGGGSGGGGGSSGGPDLKQLFQQLTYDLGFDKTPGLANIDFPGITLAQMYDIIVLGAVDSGLVTLSFSGDTKKITGAGGLTGMPTLAPLSGGPGDGDILFTIKRPTSIDDPSWGLFDILSNNFGALNTPPGAPFTYDMSQGTCTGMFAEYSPHTFANPYCYANENAMCEYEGFPPEYPLGGASCPAN